MEKQTKHYPELLAPAGNLACALAAYDAGADAVYAGLKRFNARERTENFTAEEMSKLVTYAHKNGRKVYVTFNTLVKESEICEVVEEIAELELLRPDALIVQDIGVLRIILEYFPKLEIHASTQMGLHNSAGLKFAGELGVKRVILERQIQLKELEMMMRSKPADVDLEVFIHGALCCCISGSCLLSSWLGGWSGNRGKCKQPCRRRHHSKDGNGFFLSAQDLCTLEIIPQIVQTGVSSLKIEGRLRRADYVSNVVSAYRMAVDAAHDDRKFREILPEAKELLAKTCGRKWSLGFFTGNSARELIKHDAMGVSGLLCGKVVHNASNGFTMQAARRLHIGDTIRIQPRSGDEGPSICVTKMTKNGVSVKRVLKDETCFIHSDKEVPRDGLIYKIGSSFDDFAKRIERLPSGKTILDLEIEITRKEIAVKCGGSLWEKQVELEESGKRPLLPEFVESEFASLISEKFLFGKISASIKDNPFLPASVFKTIRHEFRDWLDSNLDPAGIVQSTKKSLERFRSDYANLKHNTGNVKFHDAAIVPRGKHPQLPKDCAIVRELSDKPSPHEELLLPFFVNEPALKGVKDAIREYLSKGGKVIRITSLHHLALFEKTNGIEIKTHLPLPVCNSLAVKELSTLGVDMVQGWIELEREELEKLVRKSVLPVEIYRYGRPVLLSTRAEIAVDGEMSDARGNVFEVHKSGILTQVYADKTMDIPPVKGADANLYDLSHAKTNETDTARFNFDHTFS